MVDEPGWDIDVESCSPKTLFELYQLLKDGPRSNIVEKIKRKLVKCMRETGASTTQIINVLIANVGSRRERIKIAREWCSALDLTEEEFKNRIS